MRRINVWQFYTLGSAVRPLAEVTEDTLLTEITRTALVSEWVLEKLSEDATGDIPLKSCLPEADAFRSALSLITKKTEIGDNRLGMRIATNIRIAALRFETTLAAELRDLETYFVTPVGIFSTGALLTKAEEMFGEHRNLLPEITVAQIKEAGKCLAFSLGSAAAFHLFAALESVLREYYDILSGGQSPPKNPSMGAYLGELSKLTNVDKKLLAALWQVKDLHRNPAIHFEKILTMGEALTLVGMIHSAISTTLDVVSKLPAKATSP